VTGDYRVTSDRDLDDRRRSRSRWASRERAAPGLFLAAAFAFVFNKRGELLLLHEHESSRKYMWDLPGGTLLPDERPLDGLRREVREETGLAIEALFPFSYLKWDRHDSGRPILVAFYLAECVDTEVQMSSEHSGYRWVTPEHYLREGLTVSLDDAIVRTILEVYATCRSGVDPAR
jgi:8-oxo-dGTP diphosphatase